MVNTRRNNSSANVGAELRFNDQVFRDSQEICGQWRQYFSKLYSSSENEIFDSAHFSYVTEHVDDLKRQTVTDHDVVPVAEHKLNEATSHLSKGKACGNDSVAN